MTKLLSIFTAKNISTAKSTFTIKSALLFLTIMLMVAFSGNGVANESAVEVDINIALVAAQSHVPGKIVTHEKADVLIRMDTEEDTKTLQPVYQIKILSQQGVMKTVLVHRQTGQVAE